MSTVTVRRLHDESEILEARRLHGRRYLEVGFVDQLDPGGVIDDQYVAISDYFAAFDERGIILGVFRMIPAERSSLPIFRDFDLDDGGRRLFASIDPSQVAEMSALAVERAGCTQSGDVARALYRAFFQYSLVDAGYTHVAAALDARVAKANARRYGSTFVPIGPSRFYMGSKTIPMVFDVLAHLRHYVDGKSNDSEYFLKGLVIDLRGREISVSTEATLFSSS